MALLQAIERAGGEVKQEQIDDYARLRKEMDATTALQRAGINLSPAHQKTFEDLKTQTEPATADSFDIKITL